MDLNLALESLLGFVVVGTGAALAFARVAAKCNENAKRLDMLIAKYEREISTLEQEAHTVTELSARLSSTEAHSEKNITSLWAAYDKTSAKIEAAQDKITARMDAYKLQTDDRLAQLRDKLNGGTH